MNNIIILSVLYKGRSQMRREHTMLTTIAILLIIYTATIITNIGRTANIRKKIKVGDICSVYLGEIKFKAFVLSVSNEIEVQVLNRVMQFPRRLIYA